MYDIFFVNKKGNDEWIFVLKCSWCWNKVCFNIDIVLGLMLCIFIRDDFVYCDIVFNVYIFCEFNVCVVGFLILGKVICIYFLCCMVVFLVIYFDLYRIIYKINIV